MAAAVLLVLDRSRPLEPEDRELLRETRSTRRVVVVNKTDLPACWEVGELRAEGPAMPVSLRTEAALGELRAAVAELLWAGERHRDTPLLSNLRHIGLVERAAAALGRAEAAAAAAEPEELVLADLQDARVALEEVTGKRTSDDLLQRIFEQFCIGK